MAVSVWCDVMMRYLNFGTDAHDVASTLHKSCMKAES